MFSVSNKNQKQQQILGLERKNHQFFLISQDRLGGSLCAFTSRGRDKRANLLIFLDEERV
jgi:hypothetical protein